MRSMWSRSLGIGAVPVRTNDRSRPVRAAQGGTLTGTVTAQGGGTPLQEARVIVVGTSLFTTTGPDGKYTIRRVPAGTAEIRVIRVGYQEQKKSVRIVDGQTATLDFVDDARRSSNCRKSSRRPPANSAASKSATRSRTSRSSKLTETAPVRTIADVLERARPGRHGAAGRRRPAPASAFACAASAASASRTSRSSSSTAFA